MQHISGKLIADATIQKLENGKEFISFRIADSYSYKPKDGGERKDLTTFFSCTYWPSTGVAKVLRKGASVDLIGRLSAKPYKDRNSNWTAGLNFNASEIRFSHYAPKNESEATSGMQGNGESNENANREENTKDDLPF